MNISVRPWQPGAQRQAVCVRYAGQTEPVLCRFVGATPEIVQLDTTSCPSFSDVEASLEDGRLSFGPVVRELPMIASDPSSRLRFQVARHIASYVELLDTPTARAHYRPRVKPNVGWRLFLYFNVEGKLRYSGTSGSFDLETGDTTVMSEINYPPFGYVLVMDGAPLDDRLTEITHFIRYGFDEMAELAMPMSVLSTHSKYAGDYRTRDQILRDREAGLAAQAEMRAGATR